MMRAAALIFTATWAVFLCEAQAQNCVPEAKVRSDIAAWHGPVSVARLDGAGLAQFLAGFNAAPPVSRLEADALLIVEHRVKPNAALFLFKSGCLSVILFVPRASVRLFLQSI